MKLSSNERKQLLKVIIDSYPDITDLEILLRLELEENLDNIAGGNNNTQKIFKLIEWAETTGKLKDLLNAISKVRTDNIELQESIKSLTNNYSEDNKINLEDHQDDQKSRKKNKLALFIKSCCFGIVIIVTGFMGYRFFQPELNCNDRQLQKQDDSIKIIISNFNGNISPRLEKYLYQKLNEQLTSKSSKILVCQTLNTQQKITDGSEARKLGKQLISEKNRDLVLIIWLDEITLTGGIEFINDKPEIPLSFDLDAENRNILDSEFYEKVYLFTSYGLSKIFYYQLNNSSQSQSILQNALNNTINCDPKKSNKIANNKQIANLYFELGLSYEDKEFQNFSQALRGYECGLSFDKNANKISFQIASVYERLGNKLKAKVIYEELTKSNNVHNDIKSSAYAQIGVLFALEKKCSEAERELNNSVNYSLYIGLESRAYTRFFDCQKFQDAIEDLVKLCQGIDKNECKDILTSYHDRLFKLEKNQQKYVVERLEKLSQSQPRWQSIINPILEK